MTACISLADVERRHLPLALASLHHRLTVGTTLSLTFAADETDTGAAVPVADIVGGAGFRIDEPTALRLASMLVTRERTLPDVVGPDMRLLVCGLNPSLYAADAGVGFARPGNRFWPAALAAGLVTRDRDAFDALTAHGIGMADLVKRAAPRADALTTPEYAAGVVRVDRLTRWLQPRAVCFVGLAGWRAAVDRGAVAGEQPHGFGGRPAYVMPSTSGVNARVTLDEFATHLRAAVTLATNATDR